MKINGFYFSFEAIITLLLILIIFLSPIQRIDADTDKLFLQQKMHDLLLVWIKTRNFNENDLKLDFGFVFENKDGLIEVNGKKIEIVGNNFIHKQKFVESAYYVNENFKYEKIVLTVFD